MKKVKTLLLAIAGLGILGFTLPKSDTTPNSSDVLSFAEVEKKPIFPGCESLSSEGEQTACFIQSVQKHIAKNFVYPDEAQEKKIEGQMFLSFIINTDGSVSDVEVMRSVHESLDKAAIASIETLNDLNPRIKPAMQKGAPVRVKMTIPIKAKLDEKN